MIREECNVNGVFAGHTALQAASQNGHLEVSIALDSYYYLLLKFCVHVYLDAQGTHILTLWVWEQENLLIYLVQPERNVMSGVFARHTALQAAAS